MHNDDQNILQILDQSACLSKQQLIGYLNHNLFPEELRTVELHLSSCLLCSEALEGLEAVQNAETLLSSIAPPVLPAIILPEKPAERKEIKPEVKPVHVPSQKHLRVKNQAESKEPNKYNTNPRGIWYKSIGIAAALIIGFGLVWYFELGSDKQQEHIISGNLSDTDSEKYTENAANAPQPVLPTTDSLKLLAVKETKDSVNLAVAKAEKLRKQKDSLTLLAAVKEKDTNDKIAAKALVAANEQAKEPDTEEPVPSARKQSLSADMAAMAPKKDEDSKTNKSDFELGMQQYRQNNFASALLYFKTAESNNKDPKHWEAVYLSGMCNKSLDRKRKAIKYFERVVEAKAPQAKAAQKQLDDLNNDK